MKKPLLLTSILFATSTNPIPPTIAWQSSCWNEMVFLLLRNIKPLSDIMLSQKISSGDLAEDYASLLKQTNSDSGVNVSKSDMQNFWNSSCKRMGLNSMQAASAPEFLYTFLADLKPYSTPYLGLSVSPNGKIDYGQLYQIDLTRNDTLHDALKNTRRNILSLPEYLILSNDSSRKEITLTIPLILDMSPYLKEIQGAGKSIKFVPQKTEPDEWMYELIGIGVDQPGHHSYTYIKDQYEKDPQWYYCWGIGSSPQKISLQDITKKCNAWDVGNAINSLTKNQDAANWPTILIYKRLPYSPKKPEPALDLFAQALSNI